MEATARMAVALNDEIFAVDYLSDLHCLADNGRFLATVVSGQASSAI
jgi:hypothetical protein